jgi:hypothetical protein
MRPETAELWTKQNQHDGDRLRLFAAVRAAIDVRTVLYPGSYVDLAPSFVFDSVTYVDIDKRAHRFFADTNGVNEIVVAHNGAADPDITFIHADYTADLDLPLESFDLLVSLYGGFVSEHCTQHLRVGGTLLVNPSHGDVAMASIDPRYELAGVITSRDGGYLISATDLDTHLIPKKPQHITIDLLHETGKAIGYTRSAFAYLFARVA